MNYKHLLSQVSLTCLAIALMEGLNPLAATAKWIDSLYAGQSNWTTLSITRPGSYTLEVTTILNLGDVDVELYDTTGRQFARGKKFGNETIFFTVPSGAEGTFRVRYSMPFCVNPMGACAVNMNIYRQ